MLTVRASGGIWTVVEAIMEHARQFEPHQGQVLAAESEEELMRVFDLAIHTANLFASTQKSFSRLNLQFA